MFKNFPVIFCIVFVLLSQISQAQLLINSTVEISKDTPNGASSVGLPTDGYGFRHNNIGDLNNDGTEDFAVTSFVFQGGVSNVAVDFYIHFMNQDGSIKSSVKIDRNTTNGANNVGNAELYDRYGYDVTSIGDLDLDGVIDLAVGAPYDEGDGVGSTERSGAVYIHFMNSDGSIKSTVKLDEQTPNGASSAGTLSTLDQYGISVTNIGDLNQDGIEDLAVQAENDAGDISNTLYSGAIYIHFLDRDGSIKSTVKLDEDTPNGANSVGSLDSFERYGHVAELGDLNGDGVVDIAVGVPSDNGSNSGTPNSGTIFIHFMNADGSIQSTVLLDENTPNGVGPLAANSFYGFGLINLGDVDFDGIPEIMTSPYGTEIFYIHFMNSNGSIKKTEQLYWDTLNVDTSNYFYGLSISAGDFNNDQMIDFAVSAFHRIGGNSGLIPGLLYIHFFNPDYDNNGTPDYIDNKCTSSIYTDTQMYIDSNSNRFSSLLISARQENKRLSQKKLCTRVRPRRQTTLKMKTNENYIKIWSSVWSIPSQDYNCPVFPSYCSIYTTINNQTIIITALNEDVKFVEQAIGKQCLNLSKRAKRIVRKSNKLRKDLLNALEVFPLETHTCSF